MNSSVSIDIGFYYYYFFFLKIQSKIHFSFCDSISQRTISMLRFKGGEGGAEGVVCYLFLLLMDCCGGFFKNSKLSIFIW